MIKKIIALAFISTILTLACLAQTNTFPSSGNVGIGTTSPHIVGSYSVLDITGKTTSNGGYIRFGTSNASGEARILNTNDRLLFDLQKPDMYFQWRNSANNEIYRLNQDGSARWRGNATSYTEVASNASGQFLRQYANDGTTVSWLIRGYVTNGIQAEFRQGGIEVNGRVRAREVKVETSNWPDYVFAEDYSLMPLQELGTYIRVHGRLPAMPSAQEADADGVELGEMNRKLLEKVEELTLYILKQQETINQLVEKTAHL